MRRAGTPSRLARRPAPAAYCVAIMRWLCLFLGILAACTSSWERHQQQLAAAKGNAQYAQAMEEERWLIDNADVEAPAAERSPHAEAARDIELARLAAKAGHTEQAIEALREALIADPQQATAVVETIDEFPVPAERRARLKQEFAWNSAALSPAYTAGDVPREEPWCWSYRVREVRMRRHRTVRTADGPQHEVTYDARPWRFDAASARWQLEGGWMADVGTEIQLTGGPIQPRYRAITAATHEFVADAGVPPCHRAAWRGPYDAGGRIFVADHLPLQESPGPR
jgi:hypothetical protein